LPRVIFLVPHAVGLDAALIAVVWCSVTARYLGVEVGPGTLAVLGAAVWGIYLLDRAWDATRGQGGYGLRHRMARRFHMAYLAGGGILLAGPAFMAVLFVPPVALVAAFRMAMHPELTAALADAALLTAIISQQLVGHAKTPGLSL
jgi:hypothetical protein